VRSLRNKPWLVVGILAVILAAGILFYRWSKGWRREPRPPKPGAVAVPYLYVDLKGLSEAEALQKMPPVDLDALAQEEEKQFLRKTIRQNLFTTFNIDLFAIAIIMLLLGSPWSTVTTLFVFALNLAINVFRTMLSKKRLDMMLKSLRPQATVIRDGKLKSLDPRRVVLGDLLVVAAGDQILVDGEFIGNEEIVIEQVQDDGLVNQQKMGRGDKLTAGSDCIRGRAVYRASEDGFQRFKNSPDNELELLLGELTPLQQLMKFVLNTLLVVVIFFSVLLLLGAWQNQFKLVSQSMRDAFSIIFGVAPTSLFLILIIQYTMGAMRISNLGALVYKSKTIEALSNVSTLFLTKGSLVSGIQVELQPVAPPPGVEPLSENLIRRSLGDILHSAHLHTSVGYMLAELFPGQPHRPLEIHPEISITDWSGIVFDDPDLRGTFILGAPEILKPNLLGAKSALMQGVEHSLSQAQRGMRKWLQKITRKAQESPAEMPAAAGPASDPAAASQAEALPDALSFVPEDLGSRPRWQQRLIKGLKTLLTPLEERSNSDADEADTPAQLRLLFAYLPEPSSLFDRNSQPRLPEALIPLAYLDVNDSIRPEAKKTIQSLAKTGVQIRILSEDAPERVMRLVEDLGWPAENLTAMSGGELDQLDPNELQSKTRETSIFGGLSPAQKGTIVEAFRQQGEYVAVVGDQTNDESAMRMANLRLALKSSTQAVLKLADVVLLEDSVAALPAVLVTGQRLVKGTLDTFKLQLSFVGAQLIMIVTVLLFGLRMFPYHPTQAVVIAIFAITIPNIAISAWSAAGQLSGAEMRRSLWFFILPAALTMSLLACAVFVIFWNRTPPGAFPVEILKYWKVTNPRMFYAQMAVTWALLLAGWLRLFFLQPPSQFWTGSAPLRGDQRVTGLVIFMMLLTTFVLIFPWLPLQNWLRFTWLPGLSDYAIIGVAVAVWALVLRLIWRWRWVKQLFGY
jgi:magnesium-transporting ATPase (P-type)